MLFDVKQDTALHELEEDIFWHSEEARFHFQQHQNHCQEATHHFKKYLDHQQIIEKLFSKNSDNIHVCPRDGGILNVS